MIAGGEVWIGSDRVRVLSRGLPYGERHAVRAPGVIQVVIEIIVIGSDRRTHIIAGDLTAKVHADIVFKGDARAARAYYVEFDAM